MKNALIIFSLTILILVLFLPVFSQLQDLREKNHTYEKEVIILKGRNAKLQEEKRRLEEDPVYLEKVAREKMGLAREGEVIYRISPAEGKGKD